MLAVSASSSEWRCQLVPGASKNWYKNRNDTQKLGYKTPTTINIHSYIHTYMHTYIHTVIYIHIYINTYMYIYIIHIHMYITNSSWNFICPCFPKMLKISHPTLGLSSVFRFPGRGAKIPMQTRADMGMHVWKPSFGQEFRC